MWRWGRGGVSTISVPSRSSHEQYIFVYILHTRYKRTLILHCISIIHIYLSHNKCITKYNFRKSPGHKMYRRWIIPLYPSSQCTTYIPCKKKKKCGMNVNHNNAPGRFIGRALGELSGLMLNLSTNLFTTANWRATFPQTCQLHWDSELQLLHVHCRTLCSVKLANTDCSETILDLISYLSTDGRH